MTFLNEPENFVEQFSQHSALTSAELVHFQFMKFIEVDRTGNEIERKPSFGYVVFNDSRKDYGYGTFGVSDSYTIEYDVLNQIRVKHPEFLEFIQAGGGFYVGDSWIAVEPDGDLHTH